jgi:hypothetical protein
MSTIFSEDTYFKKEFSDKLITISSVYLNGQNLPDGWIEQQKRNKPKYLHDMLIYGCPFSRSGGEFYKCFERLQHVEEVEYNRELPLHITFDFNVAPYITLCIWQLDGKEASQIDEICLTTPDNTTRKLCGEFKRKYQNHKAGVFIYGDPSGRQRTTRDQEGHDDYKIIEDELYNYHAVTRVGTSAPSIVMRGNFINTIFESNFEGIVIKISPKCVHSIADYTYLKEDAEGKKLKKKVKDKQTGASFEEFGHTSDANDYFLTEVFSPEYLNYQEPPMMTDKRTYNTSNISKSY